MGNGDTSYLKNDHVDDPVAVLAAEIVLHAVADWRDLVRARAWESEKVNPRCSFAELRIFFKSDWCEFLMQQFDIAPAAVLARLEAELAAAMLQPRKKKKHRKG